MSIEEKGDNFNRLPINLASAFFLKTKGKRAAWRWLPGVFKTIGEPGRAEQWLKRFAETRIFALSPALIQGQLQESVKRLSEQADREQGQFQLEFPHLPFNNILICNTSGDMVAVGPKGIAASFDGFNRFLHSFFIEKLGPNCFGIHLVTCDLIWKDGKTQECVQEASTNKLWWAEDGTWEVEARDGTRSPVANWRNKPTMLITYAIFNEILPTLKGKNATVHRLSSPVDFSFERKAGGTFHAGHASIIHIRGKQEQAPSDEEPVEWPREYSCRWEVRGHWRRVKGLGTGPDGLPVDGRTWVHEYVKGPKDKPLIKKIRVAGL